MCIILSSCLSKCHLFHCNSFEDTRRTVVMQAGVNGFGFVLRNSLGKNNCYNFFRINLLVDIFVYHNGRLRTSRKVKQHEYN